MINEVSRKLFLRHFDDSNKIRRTASLMGFREKKRERMTEKGITPEPQTILIPIPNLLLRPPSHFTVKLDP